MRSKWIIVVVALLAVAVAAGAAIAFTGGEDGPVVNVYSARSHYGTEEVFERFEDETGIRVEILGGNAPELYERLRAEGDHTDADLLITVDAGNLWLADEAGLLAPTVDAEIERVVPAELRDPEGAWFAITRRARTVMYSTERVQGDRIPTSYEALGDPAWKGRVCLRTSDNVYNQSLVASWIASRGEQETRRLLEAWMANEPQVLASDQEVLDAIQAGQCDIGLTNTYYLGNRLRDEPDFPVAPAWVDQDGAGVHVNVSGVGVTRHARHPAEALQLAKFLLRPESQALIAEENSEFPVVATVPPAERIAAWGEFKVDPTPVAEAGRHQPEAVALMDDVGWK
jgi:iron(III) transport system substrate-binding protein